MALTPSFSVSNNATDPSAFTITDTSTGSDGSIASRLIFLYQANNQLYGTPISFPLSAGASITPSVLNQDYAFNIVLQWLDSGGTVLYTTSKIFAFTGFLEWFFYSLTQTLAAQPNIANDVVWFDNYSKLRVLIDSAVQAIDVGESVYNAENMILAAQYLQTNQTMFF